MVVVVVEDDDDDDVAALKAIVDYLKGREQRERESVGSLIAWTNN